MYRPIENNYRKNVKGYDRHKFPECVIWVTAGNGGDCLIILDDEKTVLYDSGPAAFHKETIANIHEVLDPLGRKPDMFLISHTHYDHIGALNYIIKEWPGIEVCGAEKAIKVFASETAKRVMHEMEVAMQESSGLEKEELMQGGMRLDRILKEGDEIVLGSHRIVAYETKGHTDCSMSYMLYPEKLMLASESLCLFIEAGVISTAPLKSTRQCIESLKKMSRVECDYLYTQHYGIVPEPYKKSYFEDAVRTLEEERDMLKKAMESGMSDDEIIEMKKSIDWCETRGKSQPYLAYSTNLKAVIERMRKGIE